MSRTKRLLLPAALAGLALVVTAAAFGFGRGPNSTPVADSPVRTVEVTRMTLVDYLDVGGVIGFGDVVPLRYIPPPAPAPAPPGNTATSAGGASGSAQPKPSATDQTAPTDESGLGLVTWLPAVGTVVRRGGPLLKADEQPVVLLYGPLPLYRTLKPGVDGADVLQFENNLHALGYTGFTVDQQYTDATATAVRQWQKSVSLPPTGTVSPGRVLYAAAAVRVAEQRVLVGDVATGDILGYTTTVPSVSATVDLTRIRGEMKPGTSVTVLVDGNQGPGAVVGVGPPAPGADAGPASGSSVQVEVNVADPNLLANTQGSVTVRFVLEERKDVLVVPVVALVALAEGGYGVQVADGDFLRYVAVGAGLFARGMVEITSGNVSVGTKVVVPA